MFSRNVYRQTVLNVLVLVTVLASLLTQAVSVKIVQAESSTTGRLTIPALSLEAPIVSVPLAYPSWDLTRLGGNVGYLEGTGQANQPGNMVLAGHSTTSSLLPSVFANLHLMEPGDEIIVSFGNVEKRYIVESVTRVEESDLSPIMPTTHEQLTLLTCAIESFQASSASYSQRYIVVATPA